TGCEEQFRPRAQSTSQARGTPRRSRRLLPQEIAFECYIAKPRQSNKLEVCRPEAVADTQGDFRKAHLYSCARFTTRGVSAKRLGPAGEASTTNRCGDRGLWPNG